MTLLDGMGRPLRDLRISVTDRCNFRCKYCMPKEVFGPDYAFLPRERVLTYEEVIRLARVFAGLGVEKIRLTGGEPLVRRDLDRLIAGLVEIPGLSDITLTTNGSLLRAQAQKLKDAGLKRITVSLDSLDDAVFQRMNDVGVSVQTVLDGIAAATDAGLRPVKLNAVVQRGVNDHTMVDLARHFKGTGHIVRYIEFMDVGNTNGWNLESVVTAREIVERVNAELPIEPIKPNYRGEVARRWRYLDGTGEIGVIASITQPFCGDCSRIRISAEGEVFTCLFGSKGHDLRSLIRGGASDEDLREAIERIWRPRGDRYSEIRTEATAGLPKVEMSRIGG
ncbi:MAG: GTP 3',8-cyclase MoaA [Dehalococcoidia bacterium]|nr:GTP 3',8-cyclase MoaA [Chloroflexi bacterium CFX7]MCK6565565.1 GTP 3',8-cyclase MoaA [Dehalococcoidia bacterium]MCL4231360.1 GTP 3',8-cyclase MoaA [Dehalococcoidia bacterium]NUQ55430.1 GTP 3',8-cyclase MoaA [Dehalococcoidia bacterium]RIL03817.1 MAG: GTP 3',8-cyclase MoaA [bacterium]